MEYQHALPPPVQASKSPNVTIETAISNLNPGIVPIGDLVDGADGCTSFSSSTGPVWKKNDSKIYVVVYPSDVTSTYFEANLSQPNVRSAGAGFGIFVEPKKVSKAKFWKEKGGEPMLFTVDGGGPAPGLTVRKGYHWGINGMLVRFLINSKDDGGRVAEVHQTLDRVARHTKRGDEAWLREVLLALAADGLIKHFHIQAFVELARGVVKQQLPKGASWDHVLTINYEDVINGTADIY